MLCLTLEQHLAPFSYYAKNTKVMQTHIWQDWKPTCLMEHGATPPLKIPVGYNFNHPVCSQHFGAIGSYPLSVPPIKYGIYGQYFIAI